MGIEIIGICIVKNEDIYIERVLKNISNFCDKIRVIDNGSEDNTVDIVKKCMEKFSNISLEHIVDVNKTHSIVEQYAGEKKWIFGVDGDEIYDPEGLAYLKVKILSGKYQKFWMLRGYFYHLIDIDIKTKKATGYLAPPSKDPNKLYNFRQLKSWPTDGKQPLFHCQTHVFKNSKYYSQNYPKRKFLYDKHNWADCLLRCVHTRMLRRSSKEDYNISINGRLNLSNIVDNDKIEYNFRKKYRKGKKIKKYVNEFFK